MKCSSLPTCYFIELKVDYKTKVPNKPQVEDFYWVPFGRPVYKPKAANFGYKRFMYGLSRRYLEDCNYLVDVFLATHLKKKEQIKLDHANPKPSVGKTIKRYLKFHHSKRIIYQCLWHLSLKSGKRTRQIIKITKNYTEKWILYIYHTKTQETIKIIVPWKC